MKPTYQHLNSDERDKLAVLRSKGMSIRAIAKDLGRNPGTVSRELKRNAPPVHSGYYLAHKAQGRAVARRRAAVRRPRLKSQRVRAYVRRMLKRGWSPELIAGRIGRLGWPEQVCHEAIYQWVYEDARQLIPYLPMGHRKRFKRGYSRKHAKSHIPARVSITERSKSVERRRQFGHWEADTMVSRQSRPVLQVVVERKARFTRLNKLPNREAPTMRKTLNKALCKLPRALRKSITYDNGSENIEHQLVNAKLGTKSYFCHPYTSQEKGTVENTAGLVRRHWPKRTDFAKLSHAEVKTVERWLNNRPRKCLDFQTPAEVFSQGVALQG
jgi:IS30 family transposase